MSLKNAVFFAFIGMTLLTIVCAIGFVSDISALLAGALAPMMGAEFTNSFAGKPQRCSLPVCVPENAVLK
jgi:hypothetical protein